MTLKTKAPATPHSIIFLLLLGTKLAAINPIIIALSAASIISMNIICVSIISSSINKSILIKFFYISILRKEKFNT